MLPPLKNLLKEGHRPIFWQLLLSMDAPARFKLSFQPTSETVVSIFSSEAGPTRGQRVSQSSQQRPRSGRRAFVAKCETYLQLGLGLVVDVVTVRKANLHDELASDRPTGALRLNADLYAAAYRVVERGGAASLDLWTQMLTVGVYCRQCRCGCGGLCLPIERYL